MSAMVSTSEPPVSPRRAQTRQRLMDAAVHVLAEKGVAGASVEELCEAAGFTRGAFYSNFESKDELCFALLQVMADDAMIALRATLADIGPDAAGMNQLVDSAVDTFLAAHAQNRSTALLLRELELYALRHPEFAKAYAEAQRRTHAHFAGLIDDALTRQSRTLALPSHQVVEILDAVQKAAQTAELLEPSVPSPVAAQLKAVVEALLR